MGDESDKVGLRPGEHTTAIDRAEDDCRRGEHWLARRRLESYLLATGYDPEVLNRIGEVCWQMHDAFSAGRAWLVSTAVGEHVEPAIDTFVKYAGHEPTQVVSQLQSIMLQRSFEQLPSAVQERLRKRGLVEAWASAHAARALQSAVPVRWFDKVIPWCVLLLVLWLLFSSCTGALFLFGWIGEP